MDSTSTLKPAEVAVVMVEYGIQKHRMRIDVVFMKAVLAGVMLSMGGLLSDLLAGGAGGLNTTNPGLVKILAGFVFPIGLVMIVLQGHELLTSNMMVFPMAIIKGAVPWWSLFVNWFVVFWGNLVGSLFFGAILVKYAGILSADPWATYVRTFAVHKAVDPAWYQIFLRGIGCNWLVCIGVWQGAGAKDTLSKIVAIWFPIWTFVAVGYDHVVANMFSIPLGVMFHAPGLSAGYYIWKSLIPAFIGNIIGALFVALPAVYYLLNDYSPATALRDAEEGRDSNDSVTGTAANKHQ